MGEMVERVALAISGGNEVSDILEIHRFRARAAILAMREPTGEMVEIVVPLGVRSWKKMIDEALK